MTLNIRILHLATVTALFLLLRIVRPGSHKKKKKNVEKAKSSSIRVETGSPGVRSAAGQLGGGPRAPPRALAGLARAPPSPSCTGRGSGLAALSKRRDAAQSKAASPRVKKPAIHNVKVHRSQPSKNI